MRCQAVDEAFFGDVLGLQQPGPIGFALRKCRSVIRRHDGELHSGICAEQSRLAQVAGGQIAEEGFIYGLALVMNYAVMQEFLSTANSCMTA